MTAKREELTKHQRDLSQCTRCPEMTGPPVIGQPALSKVMLIGQAPGSRELEQRRPFAWTAGKTLFKWFASIGLEEAAFRKQVYMAAVCRCYPGKKDKGGDRVPYPSEVDNCSSWMQAEFELLRPALIIPTGKLAIGRFVEFDRLSDVIGYKHRVRVAGHKTDLIPLPHPSGASTWHQTEPGKSLLAQALQLIGETPSWRKLVR